MSVRIQDVLCIAASPRAILCQIEGEEIWIPLSQVADDSEVYGKDHLGELIITDWIAREKGIEP